MQYSRLMISGVMMCALICWSRYICSHINLEQMLNKLDSQFCLDIPTSDLCVKNLYHKTLSSWTIYQRLDRSMLIWHTLHSHEICGWCSNARLLHVQKHDQYGHFFSGSCRYLEPCQVQVQSTSSSTVVNCHSLSAHKNHYNPKTCGKNCQIWMWLIEVVIGCLLWITHFILVLLSTTWWVYPTAIYRFLVRCALFTIVFIASFQYGWFTILISHIRTTGIFLLFQLIGVIHNSNHD